MTVLETNEKPTRPPPRKFKLTTKPPVTRSQIKPTTADSGRTTSTALKLNWKSLDKKARKKNKLKQQKENKVLNKQEANVQMKNNTLRQKSKEQSKKTAAINPVRDKVKLNSNHTGTDHFRGNVLEAPNNLKDRTVHTKKKTSPRKGAQKQLKREKNSVKWKEPANDNRAFMNKTKTHSKKSSRTMRNQPQVKSNPASTAKAL